MREMKPNAACGQPCCHRHSSAVISLYHCDHFTVTKCDNSNLKLISVVPIVINSSLQDARAQSQRQELTRRVNRAALVRADDNDGSQVF
jgi:hypothetical protein